MSKKNNLKSNILINKPILIKIGLVVIAAVVAVFSFVLVYNLSYSGLIFPKTYVGGINLGSKTLVQAKVLLAQSMTQIDNKEIEIVAGEQKFVLKPSDIDIKYDAEKSVDLAWSTGRKGNLIKVLKEQIWSVFASNREQASFTYSSDKFESKLKEIVAKTDIPERDATIEIVNLEPKVMAEKAGQKIDQEKARNLILASFGDLKLKSQVNIVVETIQPKIVASVASERLEQTKKVLNNKITLTGKDKTFTLEPKDIALLIDFVQAEDLVRRKPALDLEINQEKLKKYLEGLAKDINQEAKDAKFNIANGKVSTFQLAQTGYEVEIDKAVGELTTAILDQKTKYELPIKVVEPEIKSAAENGIKEIVGSATTNYYNSSTNRRRNIQAGAKALHGVIVKPGEEFSTIAHITPVDASNGYVPELVIIDNQTKPEYGGGLCQVSSTLFRAALNTGLKITERTNHSYRVPYYEPPIGMDATIYEPKPDFKFINNMDHPILIQASVDNEASAITFTFYGTKDDRKVEMSKPVAYDITPAPDPIYTESDTLAQGEIKRIDTAHAGAKADFTYKVTLLGKVLQDTNFHSDYTPWPAKYLYGPGTTIPPIE